MSEFKSTEEMLSVAEVVLDYYRTFPNEFARDYLRINTRPFQDILLTMMDDSIVFSDTASRGQGKTWVCGVYCCTRAILYPGSLIAVASGKRGQALAVLEKIMGELISNSPELADEIDQKRTTLNSANAKIQFKNGSSIKVVTATDSARSGRANILVLDESRMIKKEVIDLVLSKFLTQQRMPKYSELSESEKIAQYNKETNKTIYLTSAFFKDHWNYTKVEDIFRAMIHGEKQFACALPYELSVKEGLLNPTVIRTELMDSNFSKMKFDMEYEAMWYGGDEGAFFNYDVISKTRNIKHPYLPSSISSKIKGSDKFNIPRKQNGEIRILSADIALMSSKKNNNDATAIFINQKIPIKNGRYTNNIIYTESCEGLRTDDQALRIRYLFAEYECDYIVLDCQGLGLGVYDALAKDIYDPDTNETYAALSCCNDDIMAARCTIPGADKVVWSVKASAQFNSDCAYMLREAFRSNRIKLLVDEFEAKEILEDISGYNKLSPSDQARVLAPYVNTTSLIDELTQLQYEENNGKIKIREKSGMRKDRYSSLSYSYYVGLQIENKLNKKRNNGSGTEDFFVIKAPSSRKGVTGFGKKQKSWY